MEQTPLVHLRGVGKGFGGVVAVHPLDLTIHHGDFLAILGPSGCGKTTLLNVIAGFLYPDSGTISIAGQDVTRVPPERRPTNMVFQSYGLFPHMTVAQNIAFGLRVAKVGDTECKSRVAEAVQLVRLDGYEHRKVTELSGGQQQRVALARAIVRKPRLFLLDEPLSNLDAKLRLETRLELHALQRALGATTVYVTHDQEEAMTLADRIAVFMDGRIVQVGSPREVYAKPQTVDVAAFIGTPPMNLLPAVWEGAFAAVDGHRLPLDQSSPTPRTIVLGIRPGDLRVADSGLPARVERVEDLGDSFETLESESEPKPLVWVRRTEAVAGAQAQ